MCGQHKWSCHTAAVSNALSSDLTQSSAAVNKQDTSLTAWMESWQTSTQHNSFTVNNCWQVFHEVAYCKNEKRVSGNYYSAYLLNQSAIFVTNKVRSHTWPVHWCSGQHSCHLFTVTVQGKTDTGTALEELSKWNISKTHKLVGWLSGRTLVSDQRTFIGLHRTCSQWVTFIWVNHPL